jgi:hypothetical protein
LISLILWLYFWCLPEYALVVDLVNAHRPTCVNDVAIAHGDAYMVDAPFVIVEKHEVAFLRKRYEVNRSPFSACCHASRGRYLPAQAKTTCTKPEQSMPNADLPPQR